MRGEFVQCLDINSAVPLLVPAGFLFWDVEQDVSREAAEGFPEHPCFGAEVAPCGLWLSRYEEE